MTSTRRTTNLRIQNVTKRFGEVVALNEVRLDVEEGEFFTLLGPSGCGKTTALRTIAGFYYPDHGDVYFGDRLMTSVPPWNRNTGLVFQNYALWPFMSVFDNIAYGLKIRRLSRQQIREKVGAVLELLTLQGLEDRRPGQLSGGQQQRVSLARALVIEPEILLLDEPLSNLDAKIRVELRRELRKLLKRVGITAVYVTHDQEEALVISDRIAVMRAGTIQQVGTPRQVYLEPRNVFVASFIGTMNFLRGVLVGTEDSVALVRTSGGATLRGWCDQTVELGQEVVLSVRPENVSMLLEFSEVSGHEGTNRLVGRISFASFRGDMIRYEIATSLGEEFRVDIHNPQDQRILEDGRDVVLSFRPEQGIVIPWERKPDSK